MPVQQIVYHMLRVFMKTERLTESADNSGAGKLSNYHIKTLMLWDCELKSKTWWIEDLNLVRICVRLLHTSSKWLTGGWWQHYFIHNCNLIDISFNFSLVYVLTLNKTLILLIFLQKSAVFAIAPPFLKLRVSSLSS